MPRQSSTTESAVKMGQALICDTCQTEFQFFRQTRSDKRHRCPSCEMTSRRNASVANYAKRRKVINRLKDKPCMDCGGTFPLVCMQFDHRDPSAKLDKISNLVGTLRIALAEIEKCDVVCANCHAIRTERQRLSGEITNSRRPGRHADNDLA